VVRDVQAQTRVAHELTSGRCRRRDW
jgi:hypothetical protein